MSVKTLVRRCAAVSPAQVTAAVCRPVKPFLRRSLVTTCSLKRKGLQQDREKQRAPRAAVGLPQLLSGCSAAVAGLLAPLLPAWALDSFDLEGMAADTSLDPGIDGAPLLDTLLVIVITYFTVMLLYLWLSSFMDDESPTGTDDSSKQSPGEQSELPPGYGSFLDAHVRTYVGPGSKQVQALRDLAHVEPLEGEDLAHLKNRLAAGAAEALELQLRECERMVRSKLLARKLGYPPSQRPPADSSGNGSSSSSSGRSAKAEAEAAIEDLMLTAVMTAPEGLSSWQHRAAMEALIDQQLNELLPPGGGKFQEDLVVRQVLRRVVQALVREESLLLLEGTDRASRMLQEAGRARKGGPGDKPWPLW